MPRPRTACTPCASIKAACSQGLPCVRCDRLSVTCVYLPRGDRKWAEARAHQVQFRRRASDRHSRDGCKNCQKRRKKCDGVYPRCQECRRLGLPDCRPRHDPVAMSNIKAGYSDLDGIPFQAIMGNSALDPSEHTVGEYLRQLALVPEASMTGSPRRGHLNESSALISRPRAHSNAEAASAWSGHLPLTIAAQISPAKMAKLHPTEHHLALHYVQHISRSLVVATSDDRNPFITELLPLALETDSVRHAMLALSACHLCKVYPMFEDTFMRQHTLALNFLNQDLQCAEQITTSLISSLLLCLLGLCHGTSSKWIIHLHGAARLIDSYPQQASTASLTRFAVDLYNVICWKARVTSRNTPSPRYTTGISSMDRAGNVVSPCNGIHPLFGLSQDLYQALDSISCLKMKVASPPGSAAHDDVVARAAEAETIERTLYEWTVPPSTRTTTDHPNHQLVRECALAADAIRWASIIYLRQIAGVSHGTNTADNNTNPKQQQQQCALENIMGAIFQIHPGSPVNGQLLLPLFIAGLVASKKADRLHIEYRLSLLESNIGMGNIANAHQFLDSVWVSGAGGGCWEELFRGGKQSVILF
ncbi:fungal-specific transcription factor domain-containing protein [Aspergillus pseudoustus]|uniref:Fungal-specific transcription factor domain-containing protein n=1 Tax=Aspergillus pseudoustus TaxID=1810923 RepID=A0ABR4KCY5_9EURO